MESAGPFELHCSTRNRWLMTYDHRNPYMTAAAQPE